MSKLREAAAAVLVAWDGGEVVWFTKCHEVMDELRATLAEPPPPPFVAATAIEQQAYAFGWWHGLDQGRELREENEALRDSCEAKADRIDRLGEMVEILQAEKAALLRPPLTTEQIAALESRRHRNLPPGFDYTEGAWYELGIRHGERAHNIGGGE